MTSLRRRIRRHQSVRPFAAMLFLTAVIGGMVGVVPPMAARSAPSSPSVAPFKGGLVSRLCSAGFNAAMAGAGKVPPPGMESFTCGCFVDQLSSGVDIEVAQSTCRQRAAERFRI